MGDQAMRSAVQGTPSAFWAAEFGTKPKGWETVSVGELVALGILWVKSGFAQGGHNSQGRGVPHLRPFNVTTDGIISLDQVKSVSPPEPNSPYWVRPGDVIFNNTNSEELVGKTALFSLAGKFVLSNHMTILRVLDPSRLDARWLSFKMQLLWRLGIFQALCRRHVNQASVSLERLKGVELVLPSLSEQRAIAHVLSSEQRAREATVAAVAATRELKRSLMRHLFAYGPVPPDRTDDVQLKTVAIGRVPAHWSMTTLGSIARIGNGSTPKRDNPAYWTGGSIPWLNSGVVHQTRIAGAPDFVTDTALAECHLPRVPRGSVVVAITGQGKTLGTAAQVLFETTVNQHLAYLRFTDGSVLPAFVLAYLQTRYDDLRMQGSAGGGTKAAITCALLKKYPLPLPPLDEQHSIASALEALDGKLAAEQRVDAGLAGLFEALLRQVFTGQVRVRERLSP